jgi:hypothetical protein
VNLQAVEVRDSVSLRPEANFTRLAQRVVGHIEVQLVIQETTNAVTTLHDPDSVPLAGRHFHICCPELRPLALDDLVDAEVVLQRVHACDIVVVRIPIVPHRPTALIDLTGHRLESNVETEIL